MAAPTLKQVIHLILAAFPKAVIRGKNRILIYHDSAMTLRIIRETPEGIVLDTGGDEWLLTCGDDLLGWIADTRTRVGPVEKDHWPQTLPKQKALPEVVRMCWHNPIPIGMPDFSDVTLFGCATKVDDLAYDICILRPGDPESPWECRSVATEVDLPEKYLDLIRNRARQVLYPMQTAKERAQELGRKTGARHLFVSPDMYLELQKGDKVPLPDYDGINGVRYTDNSISVTVDARLPAGTIQEIKPQTRILAEFNSPSFKTFSEQDTKFVF